MAQFSYKVENMEPRTSSFEPLPAGNYLAQIIESEVKDTKAGTGKYLQFTWEIIDGAAKGRRVWDRVNVVNPSAQAEQIGKEAMDSLCLAAGVLDFVDTVQLHGKPVRIKLTVRRDPNFGDSNEVKGYEKAAGIVPAAPIPAAATSAAGSAPWLKP